MVFKSNFWKELRKGNFSFACLNLAQFFGVLNDNAYKLLLIYLLLSKIAVENSAQILSMVGFLYVIPFILFSSAAGVLADRFSKQKIILILKSIELLIMSLGIWAFYAESSWGGYGVLFLLAVHSAVFGPSKYGIIPEIVDKTAVVKANGDLVALTYFAMILGVFLSSFLTDITGQSYTLCIGVLFLFSLLGFFCSLGIKKTPVQRTPQKVRLFFLQEVIQTIAECRKSPMLFPALLGSGYFLFLGAFTQLNIIPFAVESLHLSQYYGGYLFLLTALGIASASFLITKVLKKKLELSISCVSGFALSILLFFIGIFGSFFAPTAICLTLLGVFGGMFVIAFDAFIQENSPTGKRGQTIGAANFLGFVGVLIASFCLYLFGKIGLNARMGFLVMSLFTVLMSTYLSLQMLEVFLPRIARLFFGNRRIRLIDPLHLMKSCHIFLVGHFSFSVLWTVIFPVSRGKFLFFFPPKGWLFHILRFSPSVRFYEEEISKDTALKEAKEWVREDSVVFLFFKEEIREESHHPFFSFSFRENRICLLESSYKEGEEPALLAKKFED